jgi:Carboxypeptidase regulatory-like domain
MKKTHSPQSAHVRFRLLLAFSLCLAGFGLAVTASSSRESLSISRWISSQKQALAQATIFLRDRNRRGGAVKLDKHPAQRPPGTPEKAAAIPYSGPFQDLTPVAAVRTGKLRDMPAIDPSTVTSQYHLEPIPPKAPTQSGGEVAPLQTTVGTTAPTPTGLSFEGVGVGLGGFSPSSNPPDVNGRVGATQYVQWNNTSFAVFNKTTGALEYGPAAGNTLFQALGGACASHNDGDPVVSYDILAGRWVLSQFVVGAGDTSYSHQCFAVSATSDATGEYYLYDFLTDPVNFIDYPHTGVWPDGYYMSTHVFNPAGTFTAGRLYVFERTKMIAGLPARMQSRDLGAEYGFLPADLDSLTPPPAGEAEFVLGPNFTLTNLTDSFRVAVTWDPAPTMVVTPGPTILAGLGNAPCVGDANTSRACVPEPSPAATTDYVDNIGNHYMHRLAYRNNGTQASPQESLVVSGPSSGSDSNHGAVEWFEFRNPTPGSSTTTPVVFQSGTYDIDTNYRWLPSIAMDKAGNIALGYSKSSTTVKPGIYITGRLATDPINTMGAELEMQAGIGVQVAPAGNRWGDYSSMTLDPIDQCTFYYTNEYLKTNGAFNWSTRIASYKFPTCVSSASLYGTVTGKITSSETGAPIQGVTVTLSNGYAGASNSDGVYTILVPAGTYTATAADANRNCTTASPPSAPVTVPGGGTVTQNFAMTGTSKLEANGFTVSDPLGNNNGIVNRAECVYLNLGVKNNGCAKEHAISATLTTTTPGVTVVDAKSNYPDMVIDAGGTNTTPFKISLSNTFSCGTPIALSLNLTYASGTKSIAFSIPTCAGGPDQTIPPYTLTTSDSTQTDRIGRDGRPSDCGGKASPGGGFTTSAPHYYKTFTFTNTSGAARCYTVTINAGLNGPGDIESVAYDQVYDPTNIDTNYLGDTGISGLGTTVDKATYSFTVPAGHNFVIVVNTTGSATSGTTASSQFSGTVSGFIDNTPGPGACTTSPTPAPTATASPTPTATPTPTPPVTQAVNLSTRLRTNTGDNSGIGGFIITGNNPKRVIIRGLGPSLTKFGFKASDLLADPTLEVHGPSGFATTINDNWRDAQEAQIQATGLAPTNDLEAALDLTLAPGNYTAILRGNGSGVGIGLVEVYDVTTASSKLANISTRAFVGTGNNVVIAGFTLGNNGGNDRIVIRGLGPSLTSFGVTNPLQDPTLELRDQNGALLKANNDWTDDPVQAVEITNAGLAPSNSKESAIAATLGPAPYTAILAGLNGGQGVGTVEVYDRGP